MRLVTFDPFRTLGMPGVRAMKPEDLASRRGEIEAADWVLFPKEWQANLIAHGLRKRIFPSYPTYAFGRDKVEMTRAFQAICPGNVPETRILPSGPESVERVLETMDLPLVAKVVRESMGRGVRLVETREELARFAAEVEVLYVQERLPIDRDLRVVVVGDRAVAAYWRVGAEGSFLHNVARGGRLEFADVPPAAVTLAERVARELGVDHAGFDVALVGGHPYLLELNVLFGNAGLLELGVDVPALILEFLRRSGRDPRTPPLAA